jgi:hypothetical protein
VPDNYTPATDASLAYASDDVGGVQYPVVKLDLGGDGVSVPVSGAVPVSGPLTNAQLRATEVPVQLLGEAIEALEAMRFAIQSLTRTMGLMQPDTGARMRVAIETLSAAVTLAAVTTVTTVGTVTNQSQVGGVSANDQIPALMRLGADTLRQNISVT